MTPLLALKEALAAIPHDTHTQVSGPVLRKTLGDLPDVVLSRLQLVSGETLNLISALAATYRGEEANEPFAASPPRFPAEHKPAITTLCERVLSEPGDLEASVLALLQNMRAQLTDDLDQLRRFERVQQLLSNLVLKALDPSRDLFEGVR